MSGGILDHILEIELWLKIYLVPYPTAFLFQELGEKSHEVILHFPEIKPHHFTNFTLYVTNIVGNSTAQVILLKGNMIMISIRNMAHHLRNILLRM